MSQELTPIDIQYKLLLAMVDTHSLIKCDYCKGMGHTYTDCPSLKKIRQYAEETEDPSGYLKMAWNQFLKEYGYVLYEKTETTTLLKKKKKRSKKNKK